MSEENDKSKTKNQDDQNLDLSLQRLLTNPFPPRGSPSPSYVPELLFPPLPKKKKKTCAINLAGARLKRAAGLHRPHPFLPWVNIVCVWVEKDADPPNKHPRPTPGGGGMRCA